MSKRNVRNEQISVRVSGAEGSVNDVKVRMVFTMRRDSRVGSGMSFVAGLSFG